MDELKNKWKKDHKYKTKIKLTIYTLFIIVVSVYALSLNNNSNDEIIDDNKNNTIKDNSINNNSEDKSQSIIEIPNNYKEVIKIKIDNQETTYKITKNNQKQTIIKENNDKIYNYIYENNKYYELIDNNYIITTKDEVYDIVNYNYINLHTINEYLKNANNNNNQYVIYLKDIILGIDNEEYFIIMISKNKINIDYTPLMKQFNKNIEEFIVEIIIEKE